LGRKAVKFKVWLESRYNWFDEKDQRKFLMLFKKLKNGTLPPRYLQWKQLTNKLEGQDLAVIQNFIRLVILQEVFGRDYLMGKEAKIIEFLNSLADQPGEIHRQWMTEENDPFKLRGMVHRADNSDESRVAKDLIMNNWSYLNRSSKIQYI
jgi:hypothetical protein